MAANVSYMYMSHVESIQHVETNAEAARSATHLEPGEHAAEKKVPLTWSQESMLQRTKSHCCGASSSAAWHTMTRMKRITSSTRLACSHATSARLTTLKQNQRPHITHTTLLTT